MRVSELKAELDLRKIDYANMFEKDELARCLADARAAGRADPTILDDFNRQSAERAYSGGTTDDQFEAAAEAVASDGGLPGGMSPERLQQLMADPELMGMLRNPKMQEVMKKVMEVQMHARASRLASVILTRVDVSRVHAGWTRGRGGVHGRSGGQGDGARPARTGSMGMASSCWT